jgi:hypothetical protein
MSLLDELDSDDDTTPAPPKAVPAPPAEPEPKQQGKEDSPASEVEVVTAGLAAAVVAAKEEEEEEAQAGGFKMTFGKKSKKQLQKEKKEAEARKRYEEAKESMKDWDDPKVAEDERLAMQLAPLSLKIKDIQPDGHCLYRALADQCMQNLPDLDADLAKEVATWEPGAGHTQMRKICARFMQQHADDFAPFVDTDDFGAYIDKIENTAEWGGDVELTALARRCALLLLLAFTSTATAAQPLLAGSRLAGCACRRDIAPAWLHSERARAGACLCGECVRAAGMTPAEGPTSR